MKWSHFTGGILLVAGTTIGVGMLGLPVTTGFMGFWPSILLFCLCWMFMLFTAIFFIDVNCSLKGNTNLITMAGRTLGQWGRALCWIVYLLLLYSLIAAYIAACAPLFQQVFLGLFGANLPLWAAQFFLPLFFGGFIYLGTEGVDLINRLLMLGLVGAYVMLILFVPPYVKIENLSHMDWGVFAYAAPVVLTAFGYHIIIPSLSNYLKHSRRALIWIVLIGSILALVVNIIWQYLVMGAIPLEGGDGLAKAWLKGVPATGPLARVVDTPWVATGAYFFSFFAIITSFLGVGLSLADFLTDGLKIKKTWEGRLLAILLTFIPPLLFVFSYERGFLLALQYAGAFVAILLVFLPSAMAWKLEEPKFYKRPLGRAMLVLTIVFSFFIILVNLFINWGFFESTFRQIASG